MKFSDNAMSAVLLYTYTGLKKESEIKPLSMGEWNHLLEQLASSGQEPGILLRQSPDLLQEFHYNTPAIERIKRLLSRGGTVAFDLEDLEKRGIGLVTSFDSDYPVLLKRKLKKKAPPVFFYSGNLSLAKKVGIGIVGSRNIDQEGMDFTRELVRKAAAERLIVYSGGAKGADTVSEQAALDAGSAAVSFVADSLISRIKRKEIIDSIIRGNRLLLSDVAPSAGFTTARAMNRNKYIYASSYGTFVVSSDYNKGGTWTGATEALRNQWTKVLVWQHPTYEGNLRLIQKGGIPYDMSEEHIYDILTRKEDVCEQIDIAQFMQSISETRSEEHVSTQSSEKDLNLYHVVKTSIIDHLGNGMTKDEAAERFHIAKGQMNTWLKQLCEESLATCKNGLYRKA